MLYGRGRGGDNGDPPIPIRTDRKSHTRRKRRNGREIPKIEDNVTRIHHRRAAALLTAVPGHEEDSANDPVVERNPIAPGASIGAETSCGARRPTAAERTTGPGRTIAPNPHAGASARRRRHRIPPKSANWPMPSETKTKDAGVRRISHGHISFQIGYV